MSSLCISPTASLSPCFCTGPSSLVAHLSFFEHISSERGKWDLAVAPHLSSHCISQHLCTISAAPPSRTQDEQPACSWYAVQTLLSAERDQNWAEFFRLDVQWTLFTLPLQMLLAILYHLACLPCGNAQLPSYGNELGRSSSSNKPFSNFVDLPSQRLKASTAMQNMGEEVGGIPIFFPFF